MTVKMTVLVTDSDINAYLDEELDLGRAAAVAMAAVQSAPVAAKLEAYRNQTAGLRALFASVLDEPIPARLTSLTRSGARIKRMAMN